MKHCASLLRFGSHSKLKLTTVTLISLLSITQLNACQNKKDKEAASNEPYLTKTRLNEPEKLSLTDPRCQIQSEALSLARHPIDRVYYGEQIRQLNHVRQSSRQVTLTQDVSLINDPIPMKRCGLGPNTLDEAATEALDHLQNAMNFYATIDDSNHQSSFALNVHPFYEIVNSTTKVDNSGKQQKQEISGYLTDNASWSISGGLSLINIFPQSQKGSAAKEAAVWKFPAVLAHEFGHQVFYDQFPAVFEDNGNAFTQLFENTPHGLEQVRDPLSLNQTQFSLRASGEANLSESIVAVNEGIADLFGFAATGAKSGSINLPCFSSTRDLSVDSLANGRKKTIDSEALSLFISRTSSARVDACSNLAEPHIFGATLAYSILKFWDTQENIEPSQIGSLIINWLQQMNRDYEPGHGSLSFLVFAAQSGIKAKNLNAGHLEFSADECEVIRSYMPGLIPHFTLSAKTGQFTEFQSCLSDTKPSSP